MKTCKRCKQEKLLIEFYKEKPENSKDGLKASCKKCVLEKNKLSRYKHWDKYLAYQNKKYHEQPEKNHARHKIQWQKNRLNLLVKFNELRSENYPYMLYRIRLDRLARKRISEFKQNSKTERLKSSIESLE